MPSNPKQKKERKVKLPKNFGKMITMKAWIYTWPDGDQQVSLRRIRKGSLAAFKRDKIIETAVLITPLPKKKTPRAKVSTKV